MASERYVHNFHELINLTGHELRLGNSATILESAGKARVHGDNRAVGYILIDGPPQERLPILEQYERRLSRLPAPVDGTLYIVSGIVAAYAQREDVVAPARVRKQKGRIVAAHGFLRPVARGGERGN